MSRELTSSRPLRRASVLGFVLTLLVAGGLVDGVVGHPASLAGSAAAFPPVPVAAPAAAQSSSWFCAGAGSSTPGGESGSVVIANSGREPVQAGITAVSTSGAQERSTVTVGAGASSTVAETVSGTDRWGGAIVDIDGGSVAVSQVLDGAYGRSSQPCASSGSDVWYFPSGQTRINADETILLLNPYPTDCIVDMSFSTDQGIEQPVEFQGIDVPPGGLVAADIGTQMRRRTAIAATVTARVGSIVAWEVFGVSPPQPGATIVGTSAATGSLADPALPVAGVTASLGAASTSTSWVWPDGLAGGGIDEEYVIYNPTGQTADLRLSVGLAEGAAEPFALSVGPYEVVPIVSEQQARIPAGIPHSATLISTNGVPVVAARVVMADAGSTPGGEVTGLGNLLGEQMPAAEWLIPAPDIDSNHRADVVIYNPSARPVRATVRVLGGSGGTPIGPAVTVGGGGRTQVNAPAGTDQPIEVSASGPVYVEYDLFGSGGTTGVSLSAGVPLS